MTKVMVAKITRKKLGGRSSRPTTKHIRGANGKPVSIYAVDSNDDNFDSDLTYVFTRNVAKARRENKRLFGSADGLGAKRATYSGRLETARTKGSRAD
jgi:hypothetical protein